MTDPHEFECVVMLARDPVLRRSYDYYVSRMQTYAANESQEAWVNYAGVLAELELVKLTQAAFRAVGRDHLRDYSEAMTRLASREIQQDAV